MKFSRRSLMQFLGAGALSPAAQVRLSAAQVPPPPKESNDTPKIAVGMGDGGGGGGGRGGRRGGSADAAPAPDPSAGPRHIKQLGVDNVLGGLGGVPWTEESLNSTMERWSR